ncbi:MAG: InlB B-repeat-containing protein [Acholeplasmatales bacterium]|jgi:uncharacterized repeat protein (TIGR02543 family)|nr:InlB B-repeat-containing protein [Acholeplasmatales bacterium]
MKKTVLTVSLVVSVLIIFVVAVIGILRSNIKYSVSINTYNDEGSYNLTVRKNDYVVLQTPSKTGYTFLGWYTNETLTTEFKLDTKVNSNLKLYGKWEINTYSITYVLDSNSVNSSSNPTSYNASTPVIVLQNPTKPSSVFMGWYDNYNTETSTLGNEVTIINPLELKDIVLYAIFSDYYASYTVEHYLENSNGTYDITEVEHYAGLIGFVSTPEEKQYPNYHIDNIPSEKVGSHTIFRLYYDLDTYYVRYYNYDNSLLREVLVKHNEDSLVVLVPFRTGYIADGWDKDTTNVVSDLNVYPVYIARDDIPYIVNYYITSESGTVLYTTSYLIGTAGEFVFPIYIEIPDATKPINIDSFLVSPDGTTVINVYYISTL